MSTGPVSVAERIPITLLTGFLGAGKTTVLNGLLRDPSMGNAAVIVNEFGEIGLDHLLVRSAEENIVLLDSGCLCCTINSSLRETLADLWMGRVREEFPPFDRVLVETTGLAEPGPIMLAITRDAFVRDHFRLDGVVTCVDAVHAMTQLDVQPEALRQAAVADRLLLTKTDATGAGKTHTLRMRLQTMNPAAEIITVVHGGVTANQVMGVGLYGSSDDDPDAIRWLAEEAYQDHDHQHAESHGVNRHHDDIHAHCFHLERPVSWAGLAAWCDLMAQTHANELLRVKGIIGIVETGKPVIVHGVHRLFDRPLRLADWPDSDRRSRIVIISRGLDADYLRRTLDVLYLPSGSGRPATLAQAMV